VDGVNVYYGVNGGIAQSPAGAVYQVPKTGGTPVPLVADGGHHRGVIADATHVYWTDWHKDTVRRAPIGGGSVETVSTTATRPAGIAVDATYVYWATFGGGRIEKQFKSGGNPSTPLLVTTITAQAEGIAINDDWLVWGEPASRAWKIPIGGGTKAQLENAPTYIGDVAVDATRAYWTVYGFDVNKAVVRTVALAGGSVTSLTNTTLNHAKAIAIDDQCVYFTLYGVGGSVNVVSR
jgi:hypothetical protein